MRLILYSIVLCTLTACNIISRDEVARVLSPDRQFEAVIVETNGGATTSFGYEVYVVLAGKKLTKSKPVASLYGAVRSENAYGINLIWGTSRRLTIQYLSAKNANVIKEMEVDGQKVEVFVESGVYDPSAPAGGMLHNLIKQKKA